MPGEFKAALARAADLTQAAIRDALAGAEGPVAEAMLYAVEGGKGLRGFYVLEGAALHGISASDAVHGAGAVECIHAYSLVHDDMPLMDDDDLRRGRPTVHKAWDEVTAMLAGDGLQALAFEMAGAGDLAADPALLALMAAPGRN